MMSQEQLSGKNNLRSVEQTSTVPFLGVSQESDMQEDYGGSSNDIKIYNKFPFKQRKVDFTTLNDWLKDYHTNEQLQNLFINMDIAMKYIHEQGYYISSFALDRIALLNHSIRQIQFQELAPLPYDFSQQKKVVHDNIFMSSILHLGLYAKCLQYFTMNTIPAIKDNFQQFVIFLPPEDVPYYSGIIEKGASVYYSEYVGERKKQDLLKLERETSSDGNNNGNNSRGKSLVKTNGAYTAKDFLPDNEAANEFIYAGLSKKDAAFARVLIYPLLVFLLGVVVLFLAYLVR